MLGWSVVVCEGLGKDQWKTLVLELEGKAIRKLVESISGVMESTGDQAQRAMRTEPRA
jgi:hypothetical protein